jgi:hypothetical protein
MRAKWFLVMVLAPPTLLPLTSGLAVPPGAAGPGAGQPEGGAARADLFVAPGGRDDNPGTAEKPLATLAGARAAVRRLKADGGLKAGATVMVRAGTYRLSEPVLLDPEDSGTKEHPIVYAAYPGEKPILSGGRAIRDWKPGEGKRWAAELPAGSGELWGFTQLFVDGKRQTRSRLPDTDDWHKWWRAAGGAADVLRFPAKTLRAWPNVEDVEVNLVPQYTWQNQIVPLRAIDPAARTATLRCALPAYSVTAGSPFRVENVPQGVTRPGAWALDTRTRTVTLWPEDGVDLAKAAVTAPALPVLVCCVGSEKGDRLVRGLTFRGLTFTQTDRVPLHERDPKDTGNRELIEGNVVWDCGATHIDYEHGGRNNNRWVGNVLSAGKDEPAGAKALRETIVASRKKGLNPPDVRPGTENWRGRT